jgi:hypothetical protein
MPRISYAAIIRSKVVGLNVILNCQLSELHDNILVPFLRSHCALLLDPTHYTRLMTAKARKCDFRAAEGTYMGHQVGGGGVCAPRS